MTSLCEAGFAFSVVHVTNNKYSEMRIMSVERKGNFLPTVLPLFCFAAKQISDIYFSVE